MDAEYNKGQRLFVETTNGKFEGVFHCMDAGHNKMSLTDVIVHPSGKEVCPLYRFFRNEVLSVRVLEPCSYTGVNIENEAAGDWNLMRKAQGTAHSNKPLGKVTEADVVMNMMPGYGTKFGSNRRDKLSTEEYEELSKLVQNNVLIDRLGDVFDQAIEDINKEKHVGLHVEGARLGRRSRINLLCVATPNRLFLFDIHVIGDSAFDNGLRKLLESNIIEKVVHNCRLVSDCLYHVHNVTLNFIFDTQVADVMITRERYGQFPRCVRSLPECLSRYLNLPDNLIYKPQIRSGYIAMDCAKWTNRPLLMELQAGAAMSCAYLLHLHEKLYEQLMKPFRQAVDLFCNAVKDAEELESNELEVDSQASVVHVPMALLSLNDVKQSEK